MIDDGVDYERMHREIRRRRGPAESQECGFRKCHAVAYDWAIDHRKEGLLFETVSSSVDDYVALCRSHHRSLDEWARRERLVREAVELAGDNAHLVGLIVALGRHAHAQKAYGGPKS